MRVLYHFRASPYSRRARLAIAAKKLDVELRDARENPELLEESRRRSPLKTVPVLIEDDRVIGDSTAITHYLDRVHTEAPLLWPAGAEDAAVVFETAALVDVGLSSLIELGNRYYPLRDSPAWPAIRDEMMSRAQRALDGLGDLAASLGRTTIARSGWSAADIWLFTATAWLEALPERAKTAPIPAQLVSLGYRIPPALSRWADAHRDRADVPRAAKAAKPWCRCRRRQAELYPSRPRAIRSRRPRRGRGVKGSSA